MARVFHKNDVKPGVLQSQRIAVIGYGSQGHAHALNLRDGGYDVRVGIYRGAPSGKLAAQEGLRVLPVRDAVAESTLVMLLVPDTAQRQLFVDEIEHALANGATLMFAHGFNIRFGQISVPAGIDVSMVAPKSPGHRLREVFVQGGGVPAIVAVHQDVSGNALRNALAYADGIGCTRAAVIESTFTEETETDLFGEQAVLCGGVSALVQAGFETLVEAGYQPEIAYFECLHELKLIVDLMYQGGHSWMRHSVSDTAEWGDYVSGSRIIDARVREQMRALLAEIRDGSFAERWIEENAIGRPNFLRLRDAARVHAMEDIGRELRRTMPFIKPRDVAEVEPVMF